MADGIVQVPPDSTGKKIDAASMDVGANTVMRQRIVIADNSATAQFALVTGGALTVAGTMNISAMPAVVVSGTVSLGAGTNLIGAVSNAAGTALMGAVSLAAGTANIGFINNISATVTVAGNVNISTFPALVAGTALIGAVSNAAGTALMGAVSLAAGTANIGFINGISATVVVATANPYIINIPSVSHGPATTIISTSAVVVVAANPGNGVSLYVTQIMCTNGGTVNTLARIGTSASPLTVLGYMASAGGGFVLNFDPPWKLSASATAIASVKPNTVGNCYFLVNFFVAA